MPPRILIIEDEPAIADTLSYALATDGFEAVWCATGQAALAALKESSFALAVLDESSGGVECRPGDRSGSDQQVAMAA